MSAEPRRYERPPNHRFEGLYGQLYDYVIQHRKLRRAAFSIWGSADPLYELERFVADAINAACAGATSPVLVDLPSGGGTVLPFLARKQFTGPVIEIDLAAAMLRRATNVQATRTPQLATRFVQADALALPLRDGVADMVVSINGLHVVADPGRFLSEAARITKPGGSLWLITPVAGPSLRSEVILRAARDLQIIPRRPPTASALQELLIAAGFAPLHSYGGTSITGVACERR